MTVVHHEIHDLPDTAARKQCWLEIYEHDLDGRIWRAPIALWSSSRETGCDLPLEYQHA